MIPVVPGRRRGARRARFEDRKFFGDVQKLRWVGDPLPFDFEDSDLVEQFSHGHFNEKWFTAAARSGVRCGQRRTRNIGWLSAHQESLSLLGEEEPSGPGQTAL